MHDLVLNLDPLPQVFEQELKGDQGPYPPLTQPLVGSWVVVVTVVGGQA